MRTCLRVLGSIILACVSTACVNVSVQRTGERFPSYPESCPIEFQYGDLSKAMTLMSTGYVQVGSITVVKGGDSFDDAMKARVRPEACNLGGNLVLMGSSSAGSFTTNYSYVQLMVLRGRGAGPAPAGTSPP
jgi:hypothetical protein